MTPTGGLSLVLHVAIVLIGWAIKKLITFGLVIPRWVEQVFVEKVHPSFARQALAYSIILVIFGLLSFNTSVSVVNRWQEGSNLQAIQQYIDTKQLESDLFQIQPDILFELPISVIPVRDVEIVSAVPQASYRLGDMSYLRTPLDFLGVEDNTYLNF